MQKGCPKCGRKIEDYLSICPYCNYDFKEIDDFFKRVEQEKYIEEEKYAGFIKRLVAGAVDIIIVSLIIAIIFFIIKQFKIIDKPYLSIIIPIFIFIYIIISSIMERTKWHGTIGKHLVKIEVVDEYENPLTFGNAILRNIAKFLNVLTLGIGFLMCISPPAKQTLSDKITNTYVLNKVSLNDEKKHDYATTFKRILAFIIDLLIIIIQIYVFYYLLNYIMNRYPRIDELLKPFEKNIKKIIIAGVSLLYFPINEGVRGKTVGKKCLKIKITDINEEYISFTKALIRELLISVDIITFGFLLPLVDKRKQTLKDKLTKTIIIND